MLKRENLSLYFQTKRNSIRGVTPFEILVVVAILAVIITFSTSAFSRFTKQKELDNTVVEILATLEEARILSLAAKDNLSYGVHFEDSEITLFSGGTYSVSDPNNKITTLSARIIATTTLSGGGRDVAFERLSGRTDNDGTINVFVAADSSASTTIIIHTTGIAE